MKIDTALLAKRIQVASKQIKADLVVKNCRIVNVFTSEITTGDIAVADGYIAGIGSYDEADTVIEAAGKTVTPGLIDAHMHIESTMLTPRELSGVLSMHGVTTVVADPHEIANVAGKTGIDYMLKASEGIVTDMYFMLPSCVPPCAFGTSGAELSADDLRSFYSHPRVLGLAEVMDFPAVAGVSEDMLCKIIGASENGRIIDGHAAGLKKEALNIYAAAGIASDHECAIASDAKERLECGMYLMIREGTAAKDLKALLPAVNQATARRCMFVTDDKLPNDLAAEGSVDHNIRLAIAEGLDPVTAVQMATLNAAEYFGLKHLGAVAPGRQADFVILNDLDNFEIDSVFKKGVCVFGNSQTERFTAEPATVPESEILPVFHVKKIHKSDLMLKVGSDRCNIIEIVPDSLYTHHRAEQVDHTNGYFIPSIDKDRLKLAVIERHKGTGNIGLGIVKGFGLKKGAIATSVAHDSHNIVAVGVTDEDILAAVEKLIETNGGIAIASGGTILASLSLSVGGLMSDFPYTEVLEKLESLYQALERIGADTTFDPFLTLSFLTLPVIPEIKLTDMGLIHFKTFSRIKVEADPM